MSRPPENSAAPAAVESVPTEPVAFTPEERRVLLALARQSIQSALENRETPKGPISPRLLEFRGAFTTLYVDAELRGCVGYALPIAPLYRAVAETARAAAFEDGRFSPLTLEEFPRLRISLSVLSTLAPIRPDAVEVGKHGLLISLADRRGLLLPQVPTEHGWDRVTFLQQTCRKAGLPLDCWQSEAKLEAFTAESFADSDLS